MEVDYSIVLKNLSDMLDFSGVLALSKVQNISVSDVIKKGILTNIAQETLPNYKNYEYIISGITQARMMKGVHSDRNYVPSQIEKLLDLYELEEINKDLLEMSANLVISTFDSVLENSCKKVKEKYKSVIDDVEFLYINLKLVVKIIAEELRKQDIELNNITLQYVTDALKNEKTNIAQEFINAYIYGNENAVIEAKNNYRNKMEQMLNNYYENLTYNHEHASLVGEENQIVKVLGKNFLDSMTSILLVDVREKIKQKHFIA